MAPFKSGFIAIVGRPNVGKSTLLNYLAESKVAIITDKPQTTRHAIRCVINRKNAQLIFIDTPGFHKPKHELGRRLNEKVQQALKEVDLVLFLVDAKAGIGSGDIYMAKDVVQADTPIVVGVNKIDALKDDEVEVQMKLAKDLCPDAPVFSLSGLTGVGVKIMIDSIIETLSEGVKYYPDGVVSDQPELIVMAEFIREKLMEQTREEIPHSIAVVIEEAHSRNNKDIVDVDAVIYVERKSQKGIVIGKNGSVLKKVGEQARRDIEKLLGSRVNLQLWVKIRKDWREDESYIDRFGY